MLTIATPLFALPNANAHTPPWQLETWAYIAVSPDHVGVGQQAAISMWVDKPIAEATQSNDIKRHNYQLTITKPNQTIEVITYPVASDSTGVKSYLFVPDQIGNYSFKFYYPGEVYTWNATAAQRVFTGDTYLPATSKTAYLSVTEEQVPNPIDSYPLPTEYWTRPIEGQNTYWYTIASNWLGTVSNQVVGSFMPGGSAPNSPHIMWTKQLQIGEGGVVGGNNLGSKTGTTFYSGLSYNVRFSNPIIMSGILYYDLPLGNVGANGKVMAVDLRTGEQIWHQDFNSSSLTTNGFRRYIFDFGSFYSYDMYNQHGVIPEGLLFKVTGSTWRAFEPATGDWMFDVTNVPSGYQIMGPSGEYLRYQWDLTNHWLAQWNSSKVFQAQTSGSINASTAARYDWNVTIPQTISSTATVRYAIVGDMLLFSDITTTYTTYYGTKDPYQVGAISLKPGSLGTLLWIANYTTLRQTDNVGVSRSLAVMDPVNRVFILRDKETMVWQAYSIDDGSFLWTSKHIPNLADWEYFSTGGSNAYGKLYYAGYAGMLYCYDTKNGNLLWTYGTGGAGNSSDSGLYTPWGRYPLTISAIVDGKIYLTTSEHSPDSPPYKDALVRCINATDGTEIWTMMDYGGSPVAVSDGYLTFYNAYDGQVYCVGKGPSQLTVTAPDVATPYGTSVVIRGTVTDIAAGTEQNEQAARFPNGVPAVSDASQSAWMEYVYMQKPKSTDATGVPVSIDVLDSNGNYRNIGTATSDASGMFTFTWTPDVPGDFIVKASFAGSNSYYPSSAESSFTVNTPAATPTPAPQPLQSNADMYFVPAIAGLFVFVAIIGVVIILVLRKRP